MRIHLPFFKYRLIINSSLVPKRFRGLEKLALGMVQKKNNLRDNEGLTLTLLILSGYCITIEGLKGQRILSCKL